MYAVFEHETACLTPGTALPQHEPQTPRIIRRSQETLLQPAVGESAGRIGQPRQPDVSVRFILWALMCPATACLLSGPSRHTRMSCILWPVRRLQVHFYQPAVGDAAGCVGPPCQPAVVVRPVCSCCTAAFAATPALASLQSLAIAFKLHTLRALPAAHRDLSSNQLSGTLPDAMGSLAALEYLCVAFRTDTRMLGRSVRGLQFSIVALGNSSVAVKTLSINLICAGGGWYNPRSVLANNRFSGAAAGSFSGMASLQTMCATPTTRTLSLV